MSSIITHFSHSSHSTALLRKEHQVGNEDKHVLALQKIGRTRFGTHWSSAAALEAVLPNIHALVKDGAITFEVSGAKLAERLKLMFILEE
jgi:hypothetical protein